MLTFCSIYPLVDSDTVGYPSFLLFPQYHPIVLSVAISGVGHDTPPCTLYIYNDNTASYNCTRARRPPVISTSLPITDTGLESDLLSAVSTLVSAPFPVVEPPKMTSLEKLCTSRVSNSKNLQKFQSTLLCNPVNDRKRGHKVGE